MRQESIRNYWLLSGAFFTFFLTWSFCFALLPIWLHQAVGLSGEATGVIFSANAAAALLIMPCYGFVQDKLGLRKHLLLVIACLLLLCGPFFIYAYKPLLLHNFFLGAVSGGLFFGLVFSAGVGALESYIERVSRITGFEFGKARMWGSLGWAAASFGAGYLFNLNPNINFWLASASAAVFLGLMLAVRTTNAPQPEDNEGHKAGQLRPADALSLFLSRKFWALATFVMGVTCIYGVYDQQFAVYFTAQFADREVGTAMFGYLNSLQVFLEAGGMFLAPWLVNRIGAKNGLVLSGVIMAIRMIGSGFADGAVEISIMKLLHAVELPILLVALFKYIAATFDARLSATIYLVGFLFMSQLMAALLSVVAGIMYDQLGFALSYKILGTIVAFFVVLSHFLLSSDLTPSASPD